MLVMNGKKNLILIENTDTGNHEAHFSNSRLAGEAGAKKFLQKRSRAWHLAILIYLRISRCFFIPSESTPSDFRYSINAMREISDSFMSSRSQTPFSIMCVLSGSL